LPSRQNIGDLHFIEQAAGARTPEIKESAVVDEHRAIEAA
jgi:hypothetical protein